MNKEILSEIMEVEYKILKAKDCLKKSRYLNEIENTDDLFLYYNQFENSLEVVVKNSYQRLVGAIKMLRDEKICLELSTVWESEGEHHFRYGKPAGIVKILFSCKTEEIPEQLKRYKRR